VLNGIWLVIELGRDILPTNIFTKFDDYTMITIEIIERTNALDTAGRPLAAACVLIFSNGRIRMSTLCEHK